MKEQFYPLKIGDHLSASRMNRLGRVVKRYANQSRGSGLVSHHGYAIDSISVAHPPFRQNLLEVYAEEGVTAGLYYGRQRYYDYATEAWMTDALSDWLIDINGTDNSELSVGQNIVCFWDAMRGAFIPISSSQIQVVTVAKDGGVAGNPDPGGTDCTWTYTLTSLGGIVLATTISPEQARYPETIYLEAGAGGRSAYGMASYIAGAWVLLNLPGEIADATVC